ncbi:hypothetical protein BCR33DRAFT_846208 [Rhizoclosmatium globosum]|uniref:DUF4436 domain-containing protein n=1 Tax=Rhizoclosmatium globosum TaxID=329046 RepID=A0A1Y2CWI6_9FUNG|nr:hypothetical protein HDU79_001372 [Rhizoclosmatium sp. JEL0117]ORY51403.1 hypothetical protein BCR33DRAFT_846208 [Rhizoclosmatium globosum]|eukprot:ORY51403.1 hypothetical protein BCR33DRAFT_846208 [Rhizoclosmatium globosum]
MPHSPKTKLLIIIVAVVVFIGTIVGGLTAIGVTAKKMADGKSNYYVASNDTLTAIALSSDHSVTFMSIEAAMFSVDVSKNEAKAMLSFGLNGNLNSLNSNVTVAQQSSLYHQSTYNINLTIGNQVISWPAGRPLISQAITLVIQGDINTYPYDTLSVGYTIYGSYGLPGRPAQPLAINLIQDGRPTGFNIDYAAYIDHSEDALPNTEIYAVGNIARTSTIKAIAVFIALLMWGLALACAVFTACLFVFEKKAEPPFLAFHIALLFAMPGVRNAMPLAPPVGCLVDQMVLVWVMMILALCVLAQFGKLITQISEGGYAKLGLTKETKPAPTA